MFPADVERLRATADAAIDGLLDVDPALLDQESLARHVVAMHRLQRRMEAAVTKAVGGFDRYGDPQGAVGTGPWVAWRCREKKSRATATVSRARALRHMPGVRGAYEAGAIGSEHVRVLAAAWRAAPEGFEKAEHELVGAANDLRYDAFARRVAYFRQIADAEGAEQSAAEAFDRREWFASRTFEDVVAVDGVLDPIGGTVYLNELDRLERRLFEDDWREARERLGDAATANDLRRTSAQRRADAQVEMARRSAATADSAKQARTLITVLVGYETFHGMMCQLADGTVVTPGQLAPWLADVDVDVERVVFDGPSRVIDVGAKQRLFTGATRRAVEMRDLECTHPSCDLPYERCDIDHVQRYEHGGPTVQANGRVRCPHHNPGRRRRRPPPLDDG